MSINRSEQTYITINNEPLEVVNDFVYPGSLVRQDNAAHKDIQQPAAANQDSIISGSLTPTNKP